MLPVMLSHESFTATVAGEPNMLSFFFSSIWYGFRIFYIVQLARRFELSITVESRLRQLTDETFIILKSLAFSCGVQICLIFFNVHSVLFKEFV